MSAHDEHDDGEQHDGDEDDDEQQQSDDADTSFREEAEAAPVTINEWVELDEDEEDDDEFDPDEAAEEEDEDEEDEDEEAEEEEDMDEDAAALQADLTSAEQEAGATRRTDRGDEPEADEEEVDEDEEDGDDGEGQEEDGEDEEGDVSALEGGVGLMSEASIGQFVNGVMTANGPTVSTVLLKADGTKEELLPPPFDSDEVRGDMLLVRMDKHSEPQPFTLTEWQQFVDAAGNVPSDSVHSGEKRTERDGGDAGMAGEKEGTDGASSAGVSRKKQRKT